MNQRVRLLFLAGPYAVHAERRIGIFANDPRFEVAVAGPHPYAAHRARYFPLPPQGWRSLPTAYFKLRRAVRTFCPQLVFCQTMMYPSFLVLGLKVPFMVTFWNGDLLWWSKTTVVERLFKRKIVTTALRRSAAVTVNSDLARATCLSLGAEAAKTHVIRYPGVDLQAFDKVSREAARARLGLAGAAVVLAPRGPYPYQNLDTLVEAAPRILECAPNAVFVFLGSSLAHVPSAFAELEKRAAELGVAGAMHWVGHVDYASMLQYLRAADVMVSLSSKDALPASVLEAMAARAPVVAGDIPPLRDWIEPEKTGLLVDRRSPAATADAICRMLTDLPLRERCVSAARSKVEEKAAMPVEVARVTSLAAGLAR